MCLNVYTQIHSSTIHQAIFRGTPRYFQCALSCRGVNDRTINPRILLELWEELHMSRGRRNGLRPLTKPPACKDREMWMGLNFTTCGSDVTKRRKNSTKDFGNGDHIGIKQNTFWRYVSATSHTPPSLCKWAACRYSKCSLNRNNHRLVTLHINQSVQHTNNNDI